MHRIVAITVERRFIGYMTIYVHECIYNPNRSLYTSLLWTKWPRGYKQFYFLTAQLLLTIPRYLPKPCLIQMSDLTAILHYTSSNYVKLISFDNSRQAGAVIKAARLKEYSNIINTFESTKRINITINLLPRWLPTASHKKERTAAGEPQFLFD